MNKTNALETLRDTLAKLENANTVVSRDDVKTVRQGKTIIIPEGMPYAEARVWLERQEQAEEQMVTIQGTLHGFPLDCQIALNRAITEVFGHTEVEAHGPWGWPVPPRIVQITMPDGSFSTAVLGEIKPPKWEGGLIASGPSDMSLSMSATVKRKFEPEVKLIFQRAAEFVRESSIYKGQAFELDLAWREDGDGFNPIANAPKFMDIRGITEDDIILNRATHFALAANIWCLIERTEECKMNSIPLKHGALLTGMFGTGKTLTARITAAKAVANKWTFILLKTPTQLAYALKLAEMYAPSVLFCEDIDAIVSGERDYELNEILNTMDGVDTKNKAIITMLTTNNPDAINPAVLRAGRIDTVIEMAEPDAETAWRFVLLYAKDQNGQSLLSPNIDPAVVGKAFSGFVPAFISEAVQKSKRFTIHRLGTPNIIGLIEQNDLLAASEALKVHYKMVNRERPATEEEQVYLAAHTLGHAFRNGDAKAAERIEQISKRLRKVGV